MPVRFTVGGWLARSGGVSLPDEFWTPDHAEAHHALPVTPWEGSPEGQAYSLFNHHVAGLFVFLIELGEIRQALGLTGLRWASFILPMTIALGGMMLLIWSDHDA